MKCGLNPEFKLFLIFMAIAFSGCMLLCGFGIGIVGILYYILSKFQLMEFCSSLIAYDNSFVFNTLDDLYWKCAELLIASSVIVIILFVISIPIVFSIIDSYKHQKQYLQWKKKKSKWYNVLLSFIVVCD